MEARNKTRHKIKAMVFRGDAEVTQRTTKVIDVMTICHTEDEIIKSELNMSAAVKKVNQISQGSPSAFEGLGKELLSTKSTQSLKGQSNSYSSTSICHLRLNSHCRIQTCEIECIHCTYQMIESDCTKCVSQALSPQISIRFDIKIFLTFFS